MCIINFMKKIIKPLFFLLIVRPVVYFLLGLNVINRKKIPGKGPAIIVANHNSHLDAMVLMSLFPLAMLNKVRPVAAFDYFFKNRFTAWLSINCIGIIPIDRSGIVNKEGIFDACHQALNNNEILIIFPEGSRGFPEKMGVIKKGVYHLIKDRVDTKLIPIVMHGLGKSLPKGEALFVPYNCDVVVGDSLKPCINAEELVEVLATNFNQLLSQCLTRRVIDYREGKEES